MSRYLLSANPIMLLDEDGSKYSATCCFPGAWIEGAGLFGTGFIKDIYSGAVGWMMLDGTFCPVKRFSGASGLCFHPGVFSDYPQLTQAMIYTTAFWNGETYAYDSRWIAPASDNGYDNDMVRSIGNGAISYFVRDVEAGSEDFVLALNQVNYSGTYYWDLIGGKSRYDYQTLISKVKQQAVIGGNPGYPVSDRFPDYRAFPVISPGYDDQYYLCFSDGNFMLYDHAANEMVFTDKYFEDASGYLRFAAQYVREHDIFVAYAWDSTPDVDNNYAVQLKVYANEGVPVSLTTPLADKELKSLSLVTFSVRAEGDLGDGVEGVPINWSLNGGPGTLLAQQSITDIDGYATVNYLCPRDVPDSVTITAEATV